MKVRKLGDWKPKVLVFQGSPRDPDTCANMESKTHKVVEYMVSKWSPFINFQVIDLSVNHSKKPIIQSFATGKVSVEQRKSKATATKE